MKDLQNLLNNFDAEQIEIITVIVAKMAVLKAEKWTGKINFELNTNQGGFGDMHVNRGEVVRFKKQRGVRG
jgi:hypothetical protein